MDDTARALVREISEQTAEQTVKRTLTALGVDHDNPLEVQRDLASLREIREILTDQEFKQDMIYIRRSRKLFESIQVRLIIVFVGLLATGGAGLIGFAAFKTLWS